MEQVRAGLRRHTDRAPSLDTVLRVLRAGLDAELLHRVWKWQRQVDAVIPVVVHGAIQEDCTPNCCPPATAMPRL